MRTWPKLLAFLRSAPTARLAGDDESPRRWHQRFPGGLLYGAPGLALGGFLIAVRAVPFGVCVSAVFAFLGLSIARGLARIQRKVLQAVKLHVLLALSAIGGLFLYAHFSFRATHWP